MNRFHRNPDVCEHDIRVSTNRTIQKRTPRFRIVRVVGRKEREEVPTDTILPRLPPPSPASHSFSQCKSDGTQSCSRLQTDGSCPVNHSCGIAVTVCCTFIFHRSSRATNLTCIALRSDLYGSCNLRTLERGIRKSTIAFGHISLRPESLPSCSADPRRILQRTLVSSNPRQSLLHVHQPQSSRGVTSHHNFPRVETSTLLPPFSS